MAFVPPTFINFGKKVNDLFKKKYDFENTVTAKHTTLSGLTVESTGILNKDIAGRVKANYKDLAFGELEGEGSTAGKFNGKAKLTKLFTGLETTVKSSIGDPKTNDGALTASVSADYTGDSFAGSAGVQVFEKGEKISGLLDAAGVVGYEGLSVGGGFQFDVTPHVQDFTDFNVGFEYALSDFIFTLQTVKKGENVVASYYHNVSKDYQVGAKFELDGRILSVGNEFKVDADTVLKSSISTTGDINTAIEHSLLNPRVKLNLAASFKAAGSATSLTANKFGLGLTFGDY